MVNQKPPLRRFLNLQTISRILSRVVIYLGLPLLTGSSGLLVLADEASLALRSSKDLAVSSPTFNPGWD